MNIQRCGYTLMLAFCLSVFCWIIMAFVDIRSVLIGLIATAAMVAFYSYCRKNYGIQQYKMSYGIGCVLVLIGTAFIGMPWVLSIICTILMPILYPFVSYFYNEVKKG